MAEFLSLPMGVGQGIATLIERACGPNRSLIWHF